MITDVSMFRALLHYLATLLDPPTPPNASTAAPQAHPPAARQTSRRATVTTEDDGAPLLMRRDVLDAEMNVAAYAFALRGEPRDKLRGVSAQMRDFLDELLLEQMTQLDTTARAQVEIFSCGPTPMLKAVAALAREFDLPCQVSLEEYMACAVGGCAGCVVEVQTPQGPAMKRVCVDGPVFDARTVFSH